jgi:hypothetical protein
MEVEQFPGGHSNLTYLLRFGDRELGAEAGVSLQRRDLVAATTPRHHEKGRDQLVGIEPGLTHEPAQRGSGPQASRALVAGGVDGSGG